MKLRSLYHSPKGERGIGKWIVGWTWALGLFYNWKSLKYNYSHEELWIPDEKGEFLACTRYPSENTIYCGTQNIVGQCFSSTTRGDAEGVRFAPASDVLKHPERWEYIEFEVDDKVWDEFQWRINAQVGKKYDWHGVCGFVLPWVKQTNKKWFCSEICDWIKFCLYTFDKRHAPVSPRRSAMLLAKKHGEPKSL